MNLDVEAIKQAISAFGATLTVLKQAKDLLPDGKNKEQVSENIEKAEEQLNIAEIESAKSIGFKICHNHYPAGVMLSADDINWKCPTCGNQIVPKPPSKHPANGIKGL